MMNTIELDKKYALQLQHTLELFHVRDDRNHFSARFRCPLCGDSARNRFKTRGYIYQTEAHLAFKCHNCGEALSFASFLKRVDPELGRQRLIESLANGKVDRIETIAARQTPVVFDLPAVSTLPEFHRAVTYLQERKIERKWSNQIFFTRNYISWINKIIPDKFNKNYITNEDPRVVFPLYSADHVLFGVQGRSLNTTTSDRLRYITIIFDNSYPKFWGLNNVDLNRTVFVTEGIFDALAIDNCIAMLGSDARLNEIVRPQNCTVIYDNDFRNQQIVRKIRSTIDQQFSVVIWPSSFVWKDINSAITEGKLSHSQIAAIIAANTFSGAGAILRLNQWKRTE